MKKLILLIFFIFPMCLFSETLESGVNNFLNDRMFDEESNVTVGNIIHVETGKKWQLSKKIRSEIVNQLNNKPKISVIKSFEEIEEGTRIIEAEYIIIGTYEIDEKEVKISLSYSVNKNGELLRFIQFVILKSSVEMYLKDYSDRELHYIISRQNNKISDLLAKQQREKERLLQLQQIRQQNDVIERLEEGEEFPFKEKRTHSFGLATYGVLSALYGFSWHSTANGLEEKGKTKTASTGRFLGNIFYTGASICFGYAIYNHYNRKNYISFKLSATNKNFKIAMSKRF